MLLSHLITIVQQPAGNNVRHFLDFPFCMFLFLPTGVASSEKCEAKVAMQRAAYYKGVSWNLFYLRLPLTFISHRICCICQIALSFCCSYFSITFFFTQLRSLFLLSSERYSLLAAITTNNFTRFMGYIKQIVSGLILHHQTKSQSGVVH